MFHSIFCIIVVCEPLARAQKGSAGKCGCKGHFFFFLTSLASGGAMYWLGSIVVSGDCDNVSVSRLVRGCSRSYFGDVVLYYVASV